MTTIIFITKLKLSFEPERSPKRLYTFLPVLLYWGGGSTQSSNLEHQFASTTNLLEGRF